MAVAWTVGAWANDSWLGMNAGPPNAWRGATTATSAAITGTATASITEADVVAGGKTIIITLADDTWVTVGATFDAQRQAIINGLDSAQSEPTGWNAEVRDAEAVTAVVRTSDTVVTITLTPAAAYNITAQETITVTVPSAALTTSLVAVIATPTFDVSVVAPPDTGTGSGGGGLDPGEGVRRVPFKPTGFVDRPKRRAKAHVVEDRLTETRDIAAEVAAKLAREFTDENAAITASERAAEIKASLDQGRVVAEIRSLLAKKQRNEEDEMLLLLLMASV